VPQAIATFTSAWKRKIDLFCNVAESCVIIMEDVDPPYTPCSRTRAVKPERHRLCASETRGITRKTWHGDMVFHVFHDMKQIRTLRRGRFSFSGRRGRCFFFLWRCSAQQNVGADTDASIFFTLSWVAWFQFAGGGDDGNQSDVTKSVFSAAEFEAHLTDGFEEGKGSICRRRCRDFDDYGHRRIRKTFLWGWIFAVTGEDLDGLPRKSPAALLVEDGFVDAAGASSVVAGKLGRV